VSIRWRVAFASMTESLAKASIVRPRSPSIRPRGFESSVAMVYTLGDKLARRISDPQVALRREETSAHSEEIDPR